MTHFVMFDTETDLGVGLTGPDQLGGGQNDVDGPFGSYADQQVDFLHKDLASVDRLKTRSYHFIVFADSLRFPYLWDLSS